MAGLGMAMGQQQPAPAAPAPAGAAGPGMGGEEMASPEEQAIYDKFVAKAQILIYDDKQIKGILDMLAEGTPQEGLGITAATIIKRVADAAEQAGQPIPGDILLHAGAEILEDLATLATKAGIHDFSKDQEAAEGAFYVALDEYRVMQQAAGKIDPAVYQKDLEALQAADQSGELGALFNKLAQQGTGPRPAPEGDAPPAEEAMPDEDAEEDMAEGEEPDDEEGPAEDFPEDEEDKPVGRKPPRR